MNTTPGMYFQLAVSANNATTPQHDPARRDHEQQAVAATDDGRSGEWVPAVDGGRPEPPVGPPFGVTRPALGLRPLCLRPLDMAEKLVGHAV